MGNLMHTISGGIASFRSAARVPIESLKCHFLPVQEGSGDPSPENVRPISGWNNINIYKTGKNLLDTSTHTSKTHRENLGIIFDLNNDGTLTINGKVNDDATTGPVYYLAQWVQSFTANYYFCANIPYSGTYNEIYVYDTTANKRCPQWDGITNSLSSHSARPLCEVQIPAGHIITFCVRVNRGSGLTYNNILCAPMLLPATCTDTTFEPYCGEQIPITFPNVSKNLFEVTPLSYDDWTGEGYYNSYLDRMNPIIDTTNNTISITCQGSGDSIIYKKTHYAPGTYTLSYNMTYSGNINTVYKRMVIMCFKDDGAMMTDADISIPGLTWNKYYKGFFAMAGTFTVPKTVDYFTICFGISSDTKGETATFSNIQLEVGTSATAYEPYSFNNTVYGGYIDIATGEVWRTIKYYTFNGEETITDYSNGISGGKRLVSTVFDDCQSTVKYIYCDKAVVETSVQYQISHLGIRIGGGQGRFYFFVPDSMFDGEVTIDKFKQWLSENNLTATALLITPKLVGKLASMELKTFLNYNNIWSNTNDITEVSYQIHDSNMIKEVKKNMIGENDKHYQKVIWNNIANGYCNSEDYVDRNTADSTSTFDNGIATVNFHPSSEDVVIPSFRTMRINLWPEVYTTHKYYASAEFFAVDNDLALGFEYAGGHQLSWSCPANTWVHHSTIQVGRRNGTGTMYIPFNTSNYENMYAKVKNVIYVDLTLMFGEGNEPNAPEELEGLCAYNGIDLSQPQNQDLIGTTYIWKRPYKTVEWNQWGQLLSSYYYTSQNSSYTSLSFGPYEVTRTMIADSTAVYQTSIVASSYKTHIPTDATHKYYQRQEIYSSNNHRYLAIYGTGDSRYGIQAISNTWMILEGISSPSITNNGSSPFLAYDVDNAAIGDTCTVRNYMYIDLTQMFGAGKEPSLEEFKRQCTLNVIQVPLCDG